MRPFHEFDEPNEVWPRGDRLPAIRNAARAFRTRFKEQGEVRGVRSVDLVAAAYATRFALAGAARSLSPYVTVLKRLVAVQFDDFEGARRTLLWEPTVAEASEQAPFYAQLLGRYGDRLARALLSRELSTVGAALAGLGLRPEDVDYVAFGHLHLQDLRRLAGTVKPVDGEPEPHPPFFPGATFLVQRREADTLRSVHPMQWAWYVPGGMDDLIEDRIELIDGDVELGTGVALVSTPGHTDGHQSLVLNTADGVWVSSENGVCADNWHPHLSRIPGVRPYAEFYGREVVPNANSLEDPLDQYDSMVKEKALADANRGDPRWLNLLPSSELVSWRRQWPVVPTFTYGGIEYGRLERPARG